jgi:hypothetical protein
VGRHERMKRGNFHRLVGYFHQNNKKDEGQGEKRCHAKSMMSTQANERLKDTLSMCRLGRTWRKSTREGVKNGVG